jgi:organic hydroperoxide reductase OsmC/OhrA
MKLHNYEIKVEWTGNLGQGTIDYKSFKRDYSISGIGKNMAIEGSSDPAFLGDKTRYNPEELLISSIASCHMLWYLHLCAVNEIVVVEYLDTATGVMEEHKSGSGKFKEVTLFPSVVLEQQSMITKALQLHTEANKMCFIANSCNFPIKHSPTITSMD